MRRGVTAGVTAALALTVAASYQSDTRTPGTAGLAGSAGATRTAAQAAVATRTIDFGGWAINAPASWPVYRLAADPHGCVRFDVHAVYLGDPGPDQQCPAHLVGHTDALWLDTTAPASAGAAPAGEVPAGAAPAGTAPGGAAPAPGSGHGGPAAGSGAAPGQGPGSTTIVHDAAAGEIQATSQNPGLSITATYGSDPATVERIIQSLRRAPDSGGPQRTSPTTSPATAPAMTPAKAPRTAPPKAGITATSPAPAVRTAALTLPAGPAAYPSRPVAGFDVCTAPSAAALRAWKGRASVLAAYIGGADRACPDGNLSAAWVSEVRGAGWHLMPAYVGLQASCGHFHGRINPRSAASEGTAAANDAIARASELGIGRGAPIYDDMEDYNSRNVTCRTGVLAFLSAWTRQLHARGYVSGVYSGARSGVRDLAATRSVGGRALAKPDSVWIALWDGRNNLSASPYISGSAWTGRRRVKQYRGPHSETHGKVRLNIDSDWVYGAEY